MTIMMVMMMMKNYSMQLIHYTLNHMIV